MTLNLHRGAPPKKKLLLRLRLPTQDGVARYVPRIFPVKVMLLILVVAMIMVKPPVSLASQGLGWLAFGDLRGHLEPCGCDPATDLGGLRRLVKVINQEQSLDRSINVFSLGNLLEIPQGHAPSLKNPSILAGVALTMPTASLPGPTDFAQIESLKTFSKHQKKQFDQLNLVLSNATHEFKRLFAPKIETKEITVFGYTHPTNDSVEPIESWTIDRFRTLLAKQEKPLPRVLLYRGPNSLLSEIARENLFNIIITGNEAHFDVLPSQDEKLDELRLKRIEKPPIYQVPLGGQGILRGGLLQNRDVPSFQDLLKKNAQISGSPFNTKIKLVTWLTPEIGDSSLVSEIFTRYDQDVKKSFQEEGAKKLKDLASSPYGGVSTCAQCHQPIVDIYSKSRHSRAMQTLVDKQKEQDAYCVSCHSVGSQQKGGFVSIEKSPFLANVQCENCHGARKDHSKNPFPSTQMSSTEKSKKNLESRKICMNCHNSQHSPNFNFDTYWPKIKHQF